MGILELLIIVLVLAALIVGITLWITGGAKGKGEMSCGGCGYAVRGLPGLNCPECGADLRAVGINRSRQGGTRNFGVGMTIVAVLLLLSCLGMTSFLFMSVDNSVPAVPSQAIPNPAPSTQSSSSPIENADGSKTLVNPDGSKIIYHPDGSSTLIQTDGTTTTFDENGEEISNPEPNLNDTTGE